jgi:ElaB/YqjD/DUF883 family membrane-anchored ribosome-binding protein
MARIDEVTNHLHEAGDSLARAGREGWRAKRAAMDSVQDEWARIRSELEELSNDGMLSKTPELESLVARLREGVAHASDMIGETSHNASQRIARAATEADDYVHDAPWRFATMAALAGVALGVLIARR